MALSKKARQQYLARAKRNFDRVKGYSEKELDGYLSNLPISPRFHTEPMLHQKAEFLVGAYFPYWFIYGDTGTGKSKVALDLMNYWFDRGKVSKVLIMVPRNVNIASWEDEFADHAPDISYVGLFGSTEDRKDLIESTDAQAYILNYQGLVYLASTKRKVQGNKGKMMIDADKVRWLMSHFDGLVCDEVHNLKGWNTTTYKILNSMADGFNIRYGLTGTPFGRDPHDLWSQFRVIDRGETFGENMTMFRHVFFNKKVNYWGGYEYSFKRIMEKKLHNMMKNRSIRYSAEECLDLPDKIYRKVSVKFAEGAEAYYKRILAEVVESSKGNAEKESSFMKMRQISSGFVNIGEKGEKDYLDFPKNPKLEALETFIEGVPENEKIVVFNEFIHSGDKICALLKKIGIKHSRMYSGTKDASVELRNFQNDVKTRVLVANSQSGGTGLNLQIAKYACFYESPISPIVRKQAEARIYRHGQRAKKIFIFDFVTEGTVDGKILAYIKEGKDLFEALMEGRESWKD